MIGWLTYNVTTQPPRHQGTEKVMEYKPLSEREEEIAKAIIEAAYIVHKSLGPGLLEKTMRYAFATNFLKVAFTL